MVEQRQFSRIDKTLQGQLLTPDGAMPVELINVSIHGALLDVDEEAGVAPGQQLRLALSLAGEAGPAECLVHWRKDRLVGVEFVRCPLEVVSELKRLVALNLGREEVLMNELNALVARQHKMS
jgi:hypothetical protein